MRHYSLVIEEKLVGEVDRLIKEFGLYSSRSDFIRDAIRARLLEIKRMLSEGAEQEDEPEERPVEEALESAGAVAVPREHEHGQAFGGVH